LKNNKISGGNRLSKTVPSFLEVEYERK